MKGWKAKLRWGIPYNLVFTPKKVDPSAERAWISYNCCYVSLGCRGPTPSSAAEQGIAAQEAPLTPYDLHTANECFLTGTGAGLVPVLAVDGRPLRNCPGPVFTRLAGAFRQLVERETAGTEERQ